MFINRNDSWGENYKNGGKKPYEVIVEQKRGGEIEHLPSPYHVQDTEILPLISYRIQTHTREINVIKYIKIEHKEIDKLLLYGYL